ncbi:MAG: aminotransferase class IV [Deltaproteobacteria bacterium]|nr:aminotransferase class IV [Deltaproteobacteria bacterium]
MLENRIIYLNGDFIPWEEANVHIMCHSFGRGSAIFEVMSVHETESGTAIFRLDEHIGRFFNTARLLGMECPLSYDAFLEAVRGTVRENHLREGAVKVIGFYPQISFEIFPPVKMLDIAVFAIDPLRDFEQQPGPSDKGTTACISRWRKLDPQTVPVEAKAAANYLNGMMARGEAREKGFDLAIMLDTQGFVAEGGTESIFIVREGRLLTPAAGTVLRSITRKSLLEVTGVLDIESAEIRIQPEDLYQASELFCSGTPMKVLPVRKMENRVFEEVPGTITRRLSLLMADIVSGRDERFKEWLFPVD